MKPGKIQNFDIFRDQILGKGSYGTVYKCRNR